MNVPQTPLAYQRILTLPKDININSKTQIPQLNTKCPSVLYSSDRFQSLLTRCIWAVGSLQSSSVANTEPKPVALQSVSHLRFICFLTIKITVKHGWQQEHIGDVVRSTAFYLVT